MAIKNADMVIDLLLPYQRRHVENPARFTRLNWSRQTGKSFAASLRRILRGIARKRNQFLLSAGARQSRELMMKVKQHLDAMKIAYEVIDFGTGAEDAAGNPFEGTKPTTMEITLPAALGGIRIVGLPANPDTARGFTGDVLLDEFAMHEHDREIWGSIFPTVLRGNGELDVCSTPDGRQNMFYRLGDNEAFSHSTVTIDDAIADGLKADREEIRIAMGDDELFRQEFLCEFIDEATAFLTFEMIMECEDKKLPRELDIAALAECRNDVYLGLDIGRKRDLTVLWAFEKIGSTLISRGLIELAGMPFRGQFELLSSVLRNRCVRRACIDSSGLGMQLAEEAVTQFGGHQVEACTFTPAVKDQISGQMRVRFDDRTISIPADEKIRNDLHSIRKSVTAAGNVRLQAPREDGSHADRFWAAALACHGASDDGGPIECLSGGRLDSPDSEGSMRGIRRW